MSTRKLIASCALAALIVAGITTSETLVRPSRVSDEVARMRHSSAIVRPSLAQPETHYVASDRVARPPREVPTSPGGRAPADPASTRPALDHPNGVDGDRPPRAIPGVR